MMISDWQLLQNKFKERFDSEMEHDAILFMIGLQELNKPYQTYKKDQKLEVMHIGVCTVMEPYGFYEYKGRDEDGWPHWELKEQILSYIEENFQYFIPPPKGAKNYDDDDI